MLRCGLALRVFQGPDSPTATLSETRGAPSAQSSFASCRYVAKNIARYHFPYRPAVYSKTGHQKQQSASIQNSSHTPSPSSRKPPARRDIYGHGAYAVTQPQLEGVWVSSMSVVYGQLVRVGNDSLRMCHDASRRTRAGNK